MSRVVGNVTRTTPNTMTGVAVAQNASQGNRAAFSAAVNGTSLGGSFRNAREAQRAVESALGGNLARWTRQDLPGRIEHYIALAGDLDPLETYGRDLQAWGEADGGVLSAPTGLPAVRLMGDRSGKRNSFVSVVGDEPDLTPAGLSSRDTLTFAGTDQMVTPLTVDPVRMTFAVVVAPQGAGADRIIAHISGATPLQLLADAGDDYRLQSSGPDIVGPAATPGVPVVVQVVHRPSVPELRLYVNNVLAGTSNGTYTVGTFDLSDGGSPYVGAMSAALIAFTDDDSKREATYRYLRERYQTA